MGAQVKGPNILLVEGADEYRLIPELIEANGWVWEPRKEQYLVHIDNLGGLEKLNESRISANLKRSEARSVGIVIDADEEPADRWQSLVNKCKNLGIANLPETMPPEGYVSSIAGEGFSATRFGIWMMPDNQSPGMLETFLQNLIPKQSKKKAVWKFAVSCAAQAREQGAPYKEAHFDKAKIHTWLAWQEPPGRQLHNAIAEKIFQPNNSHAQGFVQWFCKLYELENI